MPLLVRHHAEEELQKLDMDPTSDFDVDIQSLISSYYHNFPLLAQSNSEIDTRVHDLWATFITSAKGTPADDARQDWIVIQVLRVREMGVVIDQDGNHMMTHDGTRVWTDLPYLLQDLQEEWEHIQHMQAHHVVNLAVFTAKLASVGVCEDQLTYCMLQLSTQMMETQDSPSVELLPAISSWFRHCGEKLYKLCLRNVFFGSNKRANPGILAQTSGVKEPGFSVPRWLFWRTRFRDLAFSSTDIKLKMEGRRLFNEMMMVGQEMQNRMSGEKEYWEKVWKAIHEELAKRGGEGSIDIEDVGVDLNWANETNKKEL